MPNRQIPTYALNIRVVYYWVYILKQSQKADEKVGNTHGGYPNQFEAMLIVCLTMLIPHVKPGQFLFLFLQECCFLDFIDSGSSRSPSDV